MLKVKMPSDVVLKVTMLSQYAKCCLVMLAVTMLSFVMLKVAMMSDAVLNVTMLSVV